MLDRVREIGSREDGLAVVATLRPDGSVQASVVNAGVVDHPVTGEEVVGFVVRGGAKKLAFMRARPRVTVVWRSGWDWVAVEGDAELAGPDDSLEGLPSNALPQLIRAAYAAAVGGTPDEWAHLDETIESEAHTAVLIRPRRVYSNPG